MDQVVPWQQLVALIEPFYRQAARPGRQPDALETTRRRHFFQQCVALSDAAMEEARYGTPRMRRFASWDENDAIPDVTTPRNFRGLLESNQLAAQLFSQVNAHLSHKG